MEITEDVEDLEIRSYYETGYLKIDKVVIMDRVDDLKVVILIYDAMFLISISCINKKIKKNDKGENK